MSYLKIENEYIVEAPYIIEKNGKVIYGYNKENNEAMLLEDGYQKFSKSIYDYKIKNNEIVEKDPEDYPKRTTFTKLEIRRAFRKLEIEDELDSILENNSQFKKDWNDAQDIDLDDVMIKEAINSGILSQELINLIEEALA